AGLTLGSQQRSSEQETSASAAAASTLGAIAGNVTIRAGQTYEQVGSDLMAGGGNIDVQAQNLRRREARTHEQRWQQDKAREGGITIGVGGAAGQALQAAQSASTTAQAIGNTDDRRMQALGVATLALQAGQGASAAAQ